MYPVSIYSFSVFQRQYKVNVNCLKKKDNLLTNLNLLEVAIKDINEHGFKRNQTL